MQAADFTCLSGLTSVEGAELFSIDLMGTTLSFRNPARTMKDKEWLRGFPIDERPFVNTVSKSGYSYNRPGQRGSCDIFQSGWAIQTGRWWKKQVVANLRLILSLETPAVDEYEAFPNLLHEDCLRGWLQAYYRDRQAVLNQVSFDRTPEGHIAMIFNDDGPGSAESSEPVSLQPFNLHRSCLPAFFVYSDSGAVELNIPVGRRDVANFHFRLKFLTEPGPLNTAVTEQALTFVSGIFASVAVTLSEEETGAARLHQS